MTEVYHPQEDSCNELTPDTPTPRIYRLGDLLDTFARDAAEAHEAYTSGKPRGPLTGFPQIDRAIGGARFPGVHVLHASPGIGKTAYALQESATCGCPALFVSCEMPPLELLRRLAARVTGTYLGRFSTGELAPDVACEAVRRACEASPDLVLVDGTMAYASPTWIRDRAIEVRGQSRHVLVVIDSLHEWTRAAGETGSSEYDQLGLALSSLRALANTLQAPVLIIAEEARDTLKGQTRRGMHSGAGHRSIEYGATTVMGMTCEDDDPDQFGNKRVTLVIEKNRRGQPNQSFSLTFNGARQEYTGGN